jgi:tetratricopeptide (TPR) repeat protein
MMSFYDRKGVDSWAQGIVPHFITSNAFIGKSYAKVLQGFIDDCTRPGAKIPIDVNEKIYIIELGTGSGKFSFFMLKALEEMCDTCQFPFENFCYVMTDFTEKNFEFWKEHPGLRGYFERGVLDAAIFDAVADTTMSLWRSGEVLQPGSCKNPICVVANYLFDTLYHDIFQVNGGTLYEGLVETGSNRAEEPDPLHPEIISRLSNRYKYNKISEDYYGSEDCGGVHLKRMLYWYRQYFKNTAAGASILVPIGALRAIHRLCKFSGNRAIFISGDKGNNNPDQFSGLMDPHIAVHGSFSLMVNYHAISQFFSSCGGFTLNNPQEEASLKVSTFVMMPSERDMHVREKWNVETPVRLSEERAKCFPYLSRSFQDSMESFGPNDFFVLQKSLKEDSSEPSLRAVIVLLKLGDWDPDVFFKFRDTLLNQAPQAGPKLRNDIVRGLPRVWANYYAMDSEKDIAFELGRFYYGIRDYENALKFYSISIGEIGPHHVTFHNQGLCFYSLGQLEASLTYFQKAKDFNSEYEKAKSWHTKVTKELASRAEKPAKTV